MDSHYRARTPAFTLLVVLIIATQIGCTSDNIHNSTEPIVQEHKDRFFVMNATNRFLSLFFEELESGLD